MASLRGFASTRLLSGLVSIGLAFALVRWMPLSEFASYIMIVSAASVASIVASLGLDRLMYRYVPEAHMTGQTHFLRRLMRFALGTRFAISAVVAVVILWLTSAFGNVVHPYWYYWVAGCYAAALGVNDVVSILANALLRFETQARVSLIALILRFACLAVLMSVLPKLGLSVVMAVLLAIEFMQVLILYVVAVHPAIRKQAKVSVEDSAAVIPDRTALQKLAATNYLSYLVGLPWQGGMLRLIVGSFGSVTDTAVFGFLQTLVDRLRQYLPIQLLQNAIEPLLVRKYTLNNDAGALCNALELLRRINFSLLMFGVASCLLIGDELISLASRGKFQEAGYLGALIVFSLAVNSIGGVLWISCNVLSQMPSLTRMFSILTLGLLPGLWLAAQHYGAIGISAMTLFPFVLTWFGLRLRRNPASIGLWRGGKDLLALFGITCAFTLGYGVKNWLDSPTGDVLGMMVCAVIYAAALWVMRVFSKTELSALREMLKPHHKEQAL